MEIPPLGLDLEKFGLSPPFPRHPCPMHYFHVSLLRAARIRFLLGYFSGNGVLFPHGLRFSERWWRRVGFGRGWRPAAAAIRRGRAACEQTWGVRTRRRANGRVV